uniref:Uncharacterized protein n=1 Tax=Anguilla anguilla TaxID=7936 RepID=A0A0E9WQ41_ANGAN
MLSQVIRLLCLKKIKNQTYICFERSVLPIILFERTALQEAHMSLYSALYCLKKKYGRLRLFQH